MTKEKKRKFSMKVNKKLSMKYNIYIKIKFNKKNYL